MSPEKQQFDPANAGHVLDWSKYLFRKTNEGLPPRDPQGHLDAKTTFGDINRQHTEFLRAHAETMGYTPERGWSMQPRDNYQPTPLGWRILDNSDPVNLEHVEAKSGRVDNTAENQRQLAKTRILVERGHAVEMVVQDWKKVAPEIQRDITELRRDFPDRFRCYEFSRDPGMQAVNFGRELLRYREIEQQRSREQAPEREDRLLERLQQRVGPELAPTLEPVLEQVLAHYIELHGLDERDSGRLLEFVLERGDWDSARDSGELSRELVELALDPRSIVVEHSRELDRLIEQGPPELERLIGMQLELEREIREVFELERQSEAMYFAENGIDEREQREIAYELEREREHTFHELVAGLEREIAYQERELHERELARSQDLHRAVGRERLQEVQHRYFQALDRALDREQHDLAAAEESGNPDELRAQRLEQERACAERINELLNDRELDHERLLAHVLLREQRAGHDVPVRLRADEGREPLQPPTIYIEMDRGRGLPPLRVPYQCREQVVSAVIERMNEGRMPDSMDMGLAFHPEPWPMDATRLPEMLEYQQERDTERRWREQHGLEVRNPPDRDRHDSRRRDR